MGIYPLDQNYGLSTWYENTGAFDLNAGTDLLLDLPRRILESDAYIYQGVSFPKGPDIYLDPGQTFSGTLNLIPYSYVVNLSGFSQSTGGEVFTQFTVRIFDRGAQTDVYQKQFGWFPTVIGNMQDGANVGYEVFQSFQDLPFGPYWFRDPLIVLPPGVLQIQLTNVSQNPNFQPAPALPMPSVIQMLFGVAVPKNTVSTNTRKTLTASDPTGTQTTQNRSGVTMSSGVSAIDILRELL